MTDAEYQDEHFFVLDVVHDAVIPYPDAALAFPARKLDGARRARFDSQGLNGLQDPSSVLRVDALECFRC